MFVGIKIGRQASGRLLRLVMGKFLTSVGCV